MLYFAIVSWDHICSIYDFVTCWIAHQDDLSTLGQLLMQGELEVWTDRKSNRAMRHGFLYEKCLLLCKKKKDEKRDDSSSHDQTRYNFKNAVQVSQATDSQAPY